MAQLALSAVGRDRPGIVAATTGALLRHGANIEDSRMAILRGHFTMTLIVSVDDATDRERLRADLDAVAADLDLEALTLNPVEEIDGDATEPTHVVVVYGVDHPGIVHRATEVLAARDVNVSNLETRLVESDGEPSLYALLMEVVLPPGLDPAELDGELRAVGEEESVEVSLRERERHEL